MTHLGATDQNTAAGREAELYGNACCLYLLLQIVEQHVSHTNHTYRQIFQDNALFFLLFFFFLLSKERCVDERWWVEIVGDEVSGDERW
jgi:hypothetical protein